MRDSANSLPFESQLYREALRCEIRTLNSFIQIFTEIHHIFNEMGIFIVENDDCSFAHFNAPYEKNAVKADLNWSWYRMVA